MSKVQPNDRELRAVFARLLSIPGVFRVGFGLRESQSQLIEEYSYRVYVRRKRGRSSLTRSQRIPKFVGGFPTDVIAAASPLIPQCRGNLQPGERITREIPNSPLSSGTIGLFVQKGGEKFILTNQHVMKKDGQIDIGGPYSKVYSPKRRTFAGSECCSPIAEWVDEPSKTFKGEFVVDGKSFFVDAALVKLAPKVGFKNEIPDVGQLIPGVAGLNDLRNASLTPTIKLRKYGATTGLTEGALAELVHQDSGGTEISHEMLVVPSPGFELDEDYEVQESDDVIQFIKDGFISDPRTNVTFSSKPAINGISKVQLKGHVFSSPGDSGAVVVDSQRRIVGLLHGGRGVDVKIFDEKPPDDIKRMLHGNTAVQHVFPMFEKLGLDPATAVIDPTITSAGPIQMLPGDEMARRSASAPSLEDLESELECSSAGRTLIKLAGRHLGAIQRLVQTERQAIVAWQRSKAQAFTCTVIRAWRFPGAVVPAEMDGVTPGEAFARFGRVLTSLGDSSLKRDIDRYGPWLTRLADAAVGKTNLLAGFREWGGDPP